MSATTALERLNRRIADLAEAGTFPPCARRPEWTSEDGDEQESARHRCRPCPAYALCDAAAAELRPTAGTWAGVTYGAAARRKAAS